MGLEGARLTEEWRRLRNRELNEAVLLNRYYSGDKIKNNEMGGTCSTYGDGTFSYGFLVGRAG